MQDSEKSEIQQTSDRDELVARVIRGKQTTLTLLCTWSQEQRAYVIREDGSDLELERSDNVITAQRLADMHLEVFREGYDRGYAAAEADHAARNTERSARLQRGTDSRHLSNPGVNLFLRHADAAPGPAEGERRDRDDGEGHAEGDRPGG